MDERRFCAVTAGPVNSLGLPPAFTPSPHAGEVTIEIRSRDACASEAYHATQASPSNPPKKGGGAPIGAPSIGRTTPCGVAASRCFGCGSGLSGDRSPFGAPPRRLRRKLMPPLSPGRVSRGLAGEGVTFAISRGYSDAPRAPVVMPADRCPDRPGAGLQAPPAGTAPAPSLGCHRSTPSTGGMSVM